MERRLGIYLLQDPKGAVDRYVLHALRGLRDVCKKVMICACGNLEKQELDKLAPFGEIIVCEKEKTKLKLYGEVLEKAGWVSLTEWDEIILMDDSLMGPIHSLEEMLSGMKEKGNADFWGLSLTQGDFFRIAEGKPEGMENCEIILPSFLVFYPGRFPTNVFHTCWDRAVQASEEGREAGKALTDSFSEAGLRWDVFLKPPENGVYARDYLLLDPVRAIREGKSPFFEKMTFILPQIRYLTVSAGEQPWELFRYLQEETDYPTKMILENLTRTCYQDDLVRTLRMTYVLPSAIQMNPEESGLKTAAVMHLYYMDLLEESAHYAKALPKNADIIILTGEKEKEQKIRRVFAAFPNHIEIRVTRNRGRDVASLLVGAADLQDRYDLICFYHDKKTKQLEPESSGSSFAYKTSQCVLASKAYVLNLIELFRSHPEIGMISGITPNHSTYLGLLGDEWGPNFENVKKLAQELKIRVPMAENHAPAAITGDVFWYRTKALRPMYGRIWRYEDFPEEPVGLDGTILHAIERLYPFAVQEAGYLPACAMPDHLAAMEINNLGFYTREYNRTRLNARIYGDFSSVLEEEKERLSPQLLAKAQTANLSSQIRLTMKRMAPKGMYRKMVSAKRKLFGPRDVTEKMDEERDRLLEG